MKGSLILSEANRVLRLHLEDKSIETLCFFTDRVRYAVPIHSIDTFLLVSGEPSSEDMALIMLSPSEAKEQILFRHKKIGLPVLSPNNTEIAWVAESNNGQTRLYVASVDRLDKPQSLRGEFAIDNAGPTWLSDASGEYVNVVAMRSGRIAKVHFQSKRVEMLFEGELPISLPHGKGIIFWRDRGIWLHEPARKGATRLLDIGYIAPYYRACQVSPDGRYLVFRTLAPKPLGTTRLSKSSPTLFLIDIQTKKKEILDQHFDIQGPWVWLDK